MKRLALYVLMLCLLPPLAAAATYVVSPSGSDTNPGTESQPFQTIARGLQSTAAGDTLYLRSGSYSGYFLSSTVRSGTTIAGYPGERPQVQGMIDLSTGSGIQGVTFKDFNLTGAAGNNAVYLGTERVRLQNMEIAYHPGTDAATAHDNGIQLYGNDNEVLNVTVHPSVYQNQTRTHGIYVSGARNVLDGVTSYDNGGYGIQLYNGGDNTAVHDNIIINSRLYHNGGSSNPGGLTINSGANNVAYNNDIYGNIGGGGGIDVMYSAIGTHVLNNRITGNAGAGILVASLGKVATSGTVLSDNTTVENAAGEVINRVDDTTFASNVPMPSTLSRPSDAGGTGAAPPIRTAPLKRPFTRPAPTATAT